MTESEKVLWQRLRRKQLRSIQFYRQKPIGRFIVDFYGPKAKLVVEVDGSQHLDPEYAQQDARRTASLERQGIRVLRFNNLQVLQELDAVVESIFQALGDAERKIPPRPPLQKGGMKGNATRTPSSLLKGKPLSSPLQKGERDENATRAKPSAG